MMDHSDNNLASGIAEGRYRLLVESISDYAIPRMGVGEQSATTLALVIHELATNSLKYGAFSVESGMLDISGTSTDEEISIVWTERWGPSVNLSGGEGYRSKLLNRSVTGQLGSSIETNWSDEGIIVTMNAGKLAK